MKNILILGKGEPCVSLVQSLSKKQLDLNHSDEIAYYLKQEGNESWTEGFLPSSLLQFEKIKLELMDMDTIYIFSDHLSEGLEKMDFFHQLGTCKIIVITHTSRHIRIYKQLADFVIISKPNEGSYHWLINRETLIS